MQSLNSLWLWFSKAHCRVSAAAVAVAFCGCVHVEAPDAVPVALYDRVGTAFLMVTREDEEDGKSMWRQGSGVAVIGEDGRHFIYTARHVLVDKEKDNALPTRFYATLLSGESVEINLSDIEVPAGNHDVARIAIPKPICRELRLADRPPRYGERLFFFGDANGVGVMCAEIGKVIAIGPLEFEHTADITRGMSGGPVVDADCRLVGLCQKGHKTTARKNGVELPSASRYLKMRQFASMLYNIKWSK